MHSSPIPHIPAKAGIQNALTRSQLSLGCVLCALFIMTLLVAFPAQAKDKEESFEDIVAETALPDGAYRYAPEACDFEMIFPSDPYIARRCPQGQASCYDVTGFTYVYDVTTSVDITVTCVPSTPAEYKAYSPPIIKTALQGMSRRKNIEGAEINAREKEGYRVGSLLGATKRGKQNGIYNAQLWVGQNSLMTIEAQLIGPSHPKADIAFGDILSSVKIRD